MTPTEHTPAPSSSPVANIRHGVRLAERLSARLAPKIRLPFVEDLRDYNTGKLRADIFAGLTLALVVIPQGVAFALVLGLPPAAMLVAAVIGGLAGALFFSSHHHVFGPTSSATLIASATVAAALAAGSGAGGLIPGAELLAWLALLVGITQFSAGLLRIGEVTKFISRSVVVAYTSAIGLILIGSQLRWLFVGNTAVAGGSGGFVDALLAAGKAALDGCFAWGDVAILAGGFALFFLFDRLRPRWPGTLITLVVLTLVAWLADQFVFAGGAGSAAGSVAPPFRLLRDCAALAGNEWFAPPVFAQSRFEMLPQIAGGAIAIALVGMLEASAVTRTLASRSGQRDVDMNQELFGMGTGNFLCGLAGSAPAATSFTRSAVNYDCGGRTQFAGAFAALAVLAALFWLSPLLAHVPVAALAALLVRVGAHLIAPAQIRVACRSTRSDGAVFIVTLGAALLLRLDVAIYAGIGLSLALFLQKTSSPLLVEYAFDDNGELAQVTGKNPRDNPQIAIIHVEGELFFGAADVFLTQVRRQADDVKIRVFILRLKNARHLDASTVMALEALHDFLRRRGQHLLMSGCSGDVLRVLRNSGISRVIGEENIFASEHNPNVSTRRALLRATALLDTGEADIRIFYDRRREKGTRSETAEFIANYQI